MRMRTAPWPAVLFLALATPLTAQPPADDTPGSFRHYPGGKVVQDLAAGQPPLVAAAALRADADAQLPDGFRLRDDGEPQVTPVGANRLYRFGLEYRGVRIASPVDYVAIVGPNGRLLSSRLRILPRSVDATVATIDVAMARAVASEHARVALGQAGALSTSVPELEIRVDEQQAGRLSWAIVVREEVGGTVRAATRYQVAAIGTPAVLSWADVIRYDTLHVQADVWDLSPNRPTVVMSLSDARLVVDGAVAGLSGEDGNLVLPVIPAGAFITGDLRGPLADVRTSGTGLTASVTAIGGDTTLHFAGTSEAALAQTTAFRWTTYANRWVRRHLPFLDSTPTPLDGLQVRVNQNFSCNAFSDGSSIHFGRAGAGCNNTATPTVILHEFGHTLHAALAINGFDGGYSEGFGDALAALVTETSCQGPGFFLGSDACLRDAADVTTWPVTSGEVHEVGSVYAQFVWALAGDVGFDTATELVLGAAVAGPVDIPDAVRLSFVADDDDGLPGTCSPHQRALEAAADSRLLPRPQTCRPAGDNEAPTATDDAFVLVEDEEAAVDLLANDTDPDGDALVVTSVQAGRLGRLECSTRPCVFRPFSEASGTESLVYTVVDTFGGEATATLRIQITPVEDPIFVSGPNDQMGLEHEPIPLVATIHDPDGPAFAIRWFAGSPASPAPCTFSDPAAVSTSMICTHEGIFPFGVVVQQGGSERVFTFANAVIVNAVPSVVVTAPAAAAAFPEQTSVTVAATFDDGPTPGPHTCEISWGDGTITTGAVGAGTCTGSHIYPTGSAGVRQIVVTVRDPGLAAGIAAVSIEITTAGTAPCVRRPGRACVAAGLGIAGRTRPAAFEFAVWQRDTRGGGQLAVVGVRWVFTAIAIRTVAIGGSDAAFSGAGSYNGRPGYTFEATVADNRRPLRPRGAPDTIRVVIRDGAGRVVETVEGDVALGNITVN